jgi:hypothetical protein
MARSSLRDPLDKFRWTVSISGFSKLGFHETSAPGYNITARSYKEGGAHLTPRQIIDTVDFKPVVLSRGVTNDTSFNRWATSFIDLVTNNASAQGSQGVLSSLVSGKVPSPSSIAENALNNGARPVPSFVRSKDTLDLFSGGEPNLNYRKDVKIEHVNRTGQVEVVYMLYGAFPIEYSPSSDFSAMSDDGVSIESITLAYESFEVLYSGLSGSAANLLTNF